LMRLFLKNLRERKAFTLIELMVVVLIIGILAALAVPQFVGQSDRAKEKKAKADLKTIGSAVEMYYTEKGTLPGELDELVGEDGYLRNIPKTPWDGDYQYDDETPYNPGDVYVPFTLYYTHNSENVYYPPQE